MVAKAQTPGVNDGVIDAGSVGGGSDGNPVGSLVSSLVNAGSILLTPSAYQQGVVNTLWNAITGIPTLVKEFVLTLYDLGQNLGYYIDLGDNKVFGTDPPERPDSASQLGMAGARAWSDGKFALWLSNTLSGVLTLGVPGMVASAESAIQSSMRSGDATQLASAAGALTVDAYFAVTGAEGVLSLSGSLFLKADRLALAAEATVAARSAAQLDGTLAVTAARETEAAAAVPKASGVAEAEAGAAAQAAGEVRLGTAAGDAATAAEEVGAAGKVVEAGELTEETVQAIKEEAAAEAAGTRAAESDAAALEGQTAEAVTEGPANGPERPPQLGDLPAQLIGGGGESGLGPNRIPLDDVSVIRQPTSNTCVIASVDMLVNELSPGQSVINADTVALSPGGMHPTDMTIFVTENLDNIGMRTVRGDLPEAIASGQPFIAVVDNGHAVLVQELRDINGVNYLVVRDPLVGAYMETIPVFDARLVLDPMLVTYPTYWGVPK